MSLKDVNVEGILSNINLELHKGEILGIGGLTESGMHELGKVMFGALENQTGTVSLPQKNVEIGSIKTAIASGVAYASKNRDQEGLMINADVYKRQVLEGKQGEQMEEEAVEAAEVLTEAEEEAAAAEEIAEEIAQEILPEAEATTVEEN